MVGTWVRNVGNNITSWVDPILINIKLDGGWGWVNDWHFNLAESFCSMVKRVTKYQLWKFSNLTTKTTKSPQHGQIINVTSPAYTCTHPSTFLMANNIDTCLSECLGKSVIFYYAILEFKIDCFNSPLLVIKFFVFLCINPHTTIHDTSMLSTFKNPVLKGSSHTRTLLCFGQNYRIFYN